VQEDVQRELSGERVAIEHVPVNRYVENGALPSIRIGKRQVDRGRVRVRSYTVETPVEEQVTLRDERVTIQRHPVDRPVSETESPGMFRDHTVELEERGEEAPVGKKARVKEEIVVGKTADERTEKVSGNVRHMEDERAARTPTRNTKSDRDPL
jgi:stress response protein YsnF